MPHLKHFDIVNNMKYKTIFIDWDKTLSFSKFWENWRGTNLDSKYTAIQEKLFSQKQIIDNWMIGKYSSEEISKMVSKLVDLDYQIILDSLIQSAKNMIVEDSVLKKIKTLKNTGVNLVVATNNMDTFNRWTFPALKLDKFFNEVLNSFYVGAHKFQIDDLGKSLFFNDFIIKKNSNWAKVY
jgi:FMN phosphatase YigB (HAD superfamily)